MERKNEILELSFELALEIIEYSELLESNRKYVIARQLLKSGTSIGANIREAQSSESRADFIHKLKIAHKEAEETDYWLLLCEKALSYPSPSVQMKANLLSIQKLLSKIISSSKLK
ncbi:four helix bundle protein [Saccharicrinis carchari]|uniref:Four helix bundle protein n=1 Tax=Saccharicrinis carchari TaxID=1168039 RepID=A0A521APT7_SACCC|nr:four helix bundle protein [Saccharicrinis carchari]SMO36650.1 four helix bundle protein [Saccharicrinis carchari]